MSRHQALGFGLAVVLLAGPVLAQNQAPQSKEALPWAQPAASADNKTAAKPDKAAAKKTATAAATPAAPAKKTAAKPTQDPAATGSAAQGEQPQAQPQAPTPATASTAEPGPLQKFFRSVFQGSGASSSSDDTSWVPQPNS